MPLIYAYIYICIHYCTFDYVNVDKISESSAPLLFLLPLLLLACRSQQQQQLRRASTPASDGARAN